MNLLVRLGNRLKKDGQLNLVEEMSKDELLATFQIWAGSDLDYIDISILDWK